MIGLVCGIFVCAFGSGLFDLETKSISIKSKEDKIFWNSTACPDTSWHEYHAKCYKLASVEPPFNYQSAVDYCTKKGYRLLVPISEQENKALVDMFSPGVKEYSRNWVWLGLRRQNGGGLNDFYDVNNQAEPVNFTNWMPGRGGYDDCVIMGLASWDKHNNVGAHIAGKWWDHYCDKHTHITICETDADYDKPPATTEKSTTTLEHIPHP